MIQVFLTLLTSVLVTGLVASDTYHDYCVVGAGPGGLQVGFFLERAGRDYVIFEKSNISGHFFELYPRHRKLISINKRHTGLTNKEFNLRHDWNSLLSDDESLKLTRYSKEMFPHADVLLKYLSDYQKKLGLKVQFDTAISNIRGVSNETAPDGRVYTMEDQRGATYTCRTLIIATGIATPNIPDLPGMELTQGYETVSIDPEDYEGKSVLILGRGNAAFEVADGIYGSTNLIHMVARSRVRLSWATHYVGDLRAVNNGLLDTYQLKSLDGVLESSLRDMKLVEEKGKLYLMIKGGEEEEMSSDLSNMFDNFALREPYDVVIRCLGFNFDFSILNNTEVITKNHGRLKKYPAIRHNYESMDSPGLFYAGTSSHSLDFRKSAGGFIHGFRYTARALARLLEWRYEGVPWPSTVVPLDQLMNVILKRINEASGPYQMFQMLGDVFIFSLDGQSGRYIEEYPINILHDLTKRTGIEGERILVISMEYGRNFSGPGKDIFRIDRATGEPAEAHTSNFLHPVLYYYDSIPTAAMMKKRSRGDILPTPDALHHIVEDFITMWVTPHSHVLPLRRFLEHVAGADLRLFYSQSCFQAAMTHQSVPTSCQQQYMRGQGLAGHEQLLQQAKTMGMLEY